jgi:hypothetical protein
MSVWLDKSGRRPDDGHGPSGRTTMRPKFWDFRWKSFLFESRVRAVRHCRSDGRMSSASNFLIKASRFRTMGMAVRTVDLLHAISISIVRASGRLSLNYELALRSSSSGRESTASGRLQQSSHICFCKENSILDRTLRDARTGNWVIRTDASWNRSFSIQRRVQTENHIVQTDDALV